jgi:hypothetical protein
MSGTGNPIGLRRRLPAALAVTGAVLAVLIAETVIGDTFSWLAAVAGGYANGSSWFPNLAGYGYDVVFAIGVGLSIWLVFTIDHSLPLTRVVVRGVLAGVAGSVLVGVVYLLTRVYAAFQGPLGDMVGFDGSQIPGGVGFGISMTSNFLVTMLPLVALAVVVLWIWQRRQARAVSASGVPDDV